MIDAKTGNGDREDLHSNCERAYRRWIALYRDPDCWTDRAKRTAMLRARIEYQDAEAELAYHTGIRFSPHRV